VERSISADYCKLLTTTTRLCTLGRSKRREAGYAPITTHSEQPAHVMQGPFILTDDDNGGPEITPAGKIVSYMHRSGMTNSHFIRCGCDIVVVVILFDIVTGFSVSIKK